VTDLADRFERDENPDLSEKELREAVAQTRRSQAALGNWRERIATMRAKWAAEDARKAADA
jgi:hypothetical protein